MRTGRGTACTACLCTLLAFLRCSAVGAEGPVNHKRWIIVTTINYPTESVRILANMTGWKVSPYHSAFQCLWIVSILLCPSTGEDVQHQAMHIARQHHAFMSETVVISIIELPA